MLHRLFRHPVVAALLLAALVMAGCGGQAAPQVAQQPTATTAPTEAPTPVPPSPTPVPPSPTPAPPTPTRAPSPTAEPTRVPAPATQPAALVKGGTVSKPADVKADPMGALLYSGSGDAFKSATFTYTMTMKMAPADDASAKAMGPAAQQLSQISINATGKGAMQVTDAAANKSDVQMDINMDAMGQAMTIQMIMIGDTAWTRMGKSGSWQKSDASAANTGGVDPKGMLETFQAATKVDYVDNKPLNGEAAHHLRFNIDPKKADMSSFLKGMNATSQSSPEELKALLNTMTVDIDVWLAARDLTLRQEQMLMTFTIPMPTGAQTANIKTSMDMVMGFGSVNQPVKIEPPSQ